LDARESNRVDRLAWIHALAMSVLEDKIFTLKWLTTPKIALGGEIPLKLLDTEIGTREVERLLGCIEYGIYT
jgi:putative toxin-antitoxin system antitoxin component (TIGR02293 family)